MSAQPSRFIGRSTGRTERVKEAVAAELERQRDGLEGLRGLRVVSIRVRMSPTPEGAIPVVLNFEVEG